MPQEVIIVKALYSYTRKHTDELSFKKGDLLSVCQQLEGGWWEGSLNGVIGWFPSNYVTYVNDEELTTDQSVDENTLIHLHNFQNEIVQHVLEGELSHVNELSQLLSIFMINLQPLIHLSFLNKLIHLRDLLTQAISLHQAFASALEDMKHSTGPKRMGKLFLHFAPSVNAIGCDYSKIHLHVVTGLEKHTTTVTRHMASFGIKFQLSKCKQQLSLVFERLGRYPLLLKEMERYLEDPHIDRGDILRAMHVYGEITERCAILRKIKEYDIDVLLSTINDWRGPPIQQLGDPILTLRVLLTKIEKDPTYQDLDIVYLNLGTSGQLSVLVIFPTCIVLLARTNQPDFYEFTTKIPLGSLIVMGCVDIETDLELMVSATSPERASMSIDTIPCQIHLTCTDQNARDLLVSTLTDLIQYQLQTERFQLQQTIHSATETEPISSFVDSTPKATVGAEINGPNVTPIPAADSNYITTNSNEIPKKMTTSINEGSVGSSECKMIGTTSKLQPYANISLELSQPKKQIGDTDLEFPNIAQTSKSSVANTVAPTASTGSTQPKISHKVDGNLGDEVLKPGNHPSEGNLTGTLTLPSGFRLLPHQITANAHVRWPDGGAGLDGDRVETLPHKTIRCLRLDGPSDMNHDDQIGSFTSLNHLGLSINKTTVPSIHGPSDTVVHHSTDPSATSHVRIRPHSPKGEVGKESRRKRADRQKSAINVDDVLRSVGKIQEIERRTTDDAMILQVIEAYCASSWTQHSCRSLSGSQNKQNSATLSPAESKTLLQQFINPKKNIQSVGTSLGSYAETAKETDSKAYALKRSDSKTKTQALSQSNMGPSPVLPSHDIAKPTGHYKNLPEDESLVQTFLPPPVILPTRGGRRL